MGLQGMINDLVKKSDFLIGAKLNGKINEIKNKNINAISRMISAAENCSDLHQDSILKIVKTAKIKSTSDWYHRYWRSWKIIINRRTC